MYIFIVLIFLIILCIVYYFIYSKSNLQKSCDVYSIKKYLINLEHRKDRLKITTELLNNDGFYDIIHYPAVNGKQLDDIEIEKLVVPHAMQSIKDEYRTEHHQLSRGAVGCSLSHINIWKEFNDSMSNDNDMILIFEDDTLPTFTIDHLHDYLQNIPADWDILLLGGIYHEKQDINNDIVEKINRFYCTHGYLIRKKCLPFLLDNAIPIEKQIDSWLSDLALDNKIKIYGIKKNYWTQNNDINSTDIQTPIDIID